MKIKRILGIICTLALVYMVFISVTNTDAQLTLYAVGSMVILIVLFFGYEERMADLIAAWRGTQTDMNRRKKKDDTTEQEDSSDDADT